MTKLSRRDAERKLRTLEMQRDTAIRVMRIWVYLSLAAVVTLLFSRLIWGLIYMVLFVVCTFITSRRMKSAASAGA
jgi:hypothetical protein